MKNNSCDVDENLINFWCPGDFLNTQKKHLTTFTGLMILNRPISINPDLMLNLWNESDLRHTVDGGTNHWLSFIQQNNLINNTKPPDFISGDFDSAKPSSINYFKNLGSKIIETPDQNETDFTKALKILENCDKIKLTKLSLITIIVIVETSGRMDQIMANINTLHKFKKINRKFQIFLMSSQGLTWLLEPGKHKIEIPEWIINEKRWCSIIPIGSSANVTTNGLKWDMTERNLEFGELVSTSNTYSGDESVITIETDKNVIWSMGTFKNTN